MAIGLLSDDKRYLEAITQFISDSRRTEEGMCVKILS